MAYKINALQTMLTLLYNLTQRPESQPDNAINTFCFHAPRRARYPHTVENTIPFCGERTLNELVQASIEFYYGYTWARNRMDICRYVTVIMLLSSSTGVSRNPEVPQSTQTGFLTSFELYIKICALMIF